MAQLGRSGPNPAIRIVTVLILIWLLIGVVAAAQRGYFSGSSTNCAKVTTTVVTILAGPLNYVGVNPKIACKVPQPSK
jgi:membrane protein YdbS with pleckstrin-like domain